MTQHGLNKTHASDTTKYFVVSVRLILRGQCLYLLGILQISTIRLDIHVAMTLPIAVIHCMSWHSVYNIWVTSTIVWSWQLHASSVRDMLQTSRDASNFNQSLITVAKLLPFDLFAESLISISGEVGVSLILHICPWRSYLVAWLR